MNLARGNIMGFIITASLGTGTFVHHAAAQDTPQDRQRAAEAMALFQRAEALGHSNPSERVRLLEQALRITEELITIHDVAIRFHSSVLRQLRQARADAAVDTCRSHLSSGCLFDASIGTAAIESGQRLPSNLAAIAMTLAAAGLDQRANEAFRSAEAAAELAPSEVIRAVWLSTIVGPMIRAQRHLQAQSIALSVLDQRARALVESAIATAYAQIGNFDRSTEIIATITVPIQRDSANSRLAMELAPAGQMDRAIDLAGRIVDRRLRDQALAAIAQTLAGQRDVGHASRIIARIENEMDRLSALTGVAVALANTGDIDQARQIAITLNVPAFIDRSMTAIAIATARMGDLPSAIAMIDRLTLQSSQEPARAAVAAVMAQLGRLDDARQLLQSVHVEDFLSSAQRTISTELARAGQFEDAFRLAIGIAPFAARAQALAEIGAAMVSVGR